MRFLNHIFALAFVIAPAITFAQVETRYVSLVREDHVPLFNCRIFADYRDEGTCNRLTRNEYFSFDRGGYAVNCFSFRGVRMEMCLDLARNLMRAPEMMINCGRAYGPREMDECEVTRRAYRRGEFTDRGYYPRPSTVTTVDSSSTTTVIDDRTVDRRVVVTNTCGPEAYDRAYNNWRIRNDELRRRARERATTGAIITIGGIILGQSDNDIISGVGNGMVIGGATLIALGLVDANRANILLPHLDPSCSSAFVTEVRRVEIERRYCTTTKYTEHGRHSSRSYYEVNCESERYVTFEEFSPWERGYPVRY